MEIVGSSAEPCIDLIACLRRMYIELRLQPGMLWRKCARRPPPHALHEALKACKANEATPSRASGSQSSGPAQAAPWEHPATRLGAVVAG